MNKKQQVILLITAAFIFLMLLVPPFHYRVGNGMETNMGYSFLFNPPSFSEAAVGTINIGTLLDNPNRRHGREMAQLLVEYASR
jgi:hypothetical protein